jgi:hypothetical protein
VKLVEGSEVYNFPINHLVHFSCKISSFYHSNSDSPKEIRQAATSSALQRARAPSRAVRRLGVWASSRRPEAASSRGWEHSDALEVRAHHSEPRPHRPSAHDVVR